MSIHFLIKSFLKNDPVSLDPYNIDKKNQILKLLIVTAAVELVLYLDLSASALLGPSLQLTGVFRTMPVIYSGAFSKLRAKSR